MNLVKASQSERREHHINRLREVNPHVELIGDFVNTAVKTMYRCNICNTEFENVPYNVLRRNKNLCCGDSYNIRFKDQITINEEVEVLKMNERLLSINELVEENKTNFIMYQNNFLPPKALKTLRAKNMIKEIKQGTKSYKLVTEEGCYMLLDSYVDNSKKEALKAKMIKVFGKLRNTPLLDIIESKDIVEKCIDDNGYANIEFIVSTAKNIANMEKERDSHMKSIKEHQIAINTLNDKIKNECKKMSITV